MHRRLLAFHLAILLLSGGFFLRCAAQDTTDRPASSSATYINSMSALDDKRKLAVGDRISYRVVEERKTPVGLVVTDSGEVEFPLIGRVSALNKTCKQLANEVKGPLEKDYFYKATVIISLDFVGSKSHGRVYITGRVRMAGPLELPPDETLTVSKAILRAGGFDQFANQRRVKLIRKKPDNPNETTTTIIDVEDIIDKGAVQNDVVLNADDMIVVPQRMFNY